MFREKKRYGQDPNVVIRSKPNTFNAPLNRRKWSSDRPLVFVCSWSDFFIEEADPWRDETWAIIDARRDLIFQILTKRIERAEGRLPWTRGNAWPHVWGVVSAENQATANERIPILLKADFAVRGVSYEPAIGPVDFTAVRYRDDLAECRWNTLTGDHWVDNSMSPDAYAGPEDGVTRLDWLIIGGESADRCDDARPFDLAWARTTIAQCRKAGVACFVKQLGARPFEIHKGNRRRLDLLARKGDDPSEWADDLRVFELPRGVRT